MLNAFPGVVFLFGSWCAAQTFVVDAAGGPGTNFPDIATAVAAVPDGAVLIVRAGVYDGFTITGKSLTVLGEPLARFGNNTTASTTTITIAGLQAGQRVVLRRLEFRGHFTSRGRVVCQNCVGPVLLEEFTQEFGAGGLNLEVTQCAEVYINDSVFSGSNVPFGARIDASNVTMLRTFVRGGLPGGPGTPATPALEQIGGSMQMVDSTLRGGLTFFGGGGNAVMMQGGDLRLLGQTTIDAEPGINVIEGAGTARVAPTIAVALVAPGIALTTADMPAVAASGGVLGTTTSATMDGPNGDLGALLLGLPAPSVLLPGWSDPWSLTGGVVVGVAVLGAPLTASVAVPTTASLEGSCFVWQGLTIDGSFAFQASNAVWTVLRATP